MTENTVELYITMSLFNGKSQMYADQSHTLIRNFTEHEIIFLTYIFSEMYFKHYTGQNYFMKFFHVCSQ